jgi:hypothetical protein
MMELVENEIARSVPKSEIGLLSCGSQVRILPGTPMRVEDCVAVGGSKLVPGRHQLARLRIASIAAVFIAIIAVATSVQFSGKRAPRHQPPLTKLQPQSLDELRREFNAASDRFRVILLLSPT